jgi:ABC-2 type transport system ATP-binding protein
MAQSLIVADRLTRLFDGRVAVQNLSIEVAAGEIVSLLGPNGAGKTTTLRMLAGLLPPSAGRIVINHTEVSPTSADGARRSVGLLTETPGLWERLSVRRNLLTYARLQGVDPPGRRVDEALALVDVAGRADDLAGQLSKGLKQRVALARALLHRPPVVLLDEPTSGLDPANARLVRDLILRLRDEGRAVLVSTHNLAEAEELSDRVAILKTRLLAVDRPAALRAATTGARVTIDTEGEGAVWLDAAASVAGRAAVQASGSRLTVHLTSGARVPDLVAALVASGARVVRVAPDERTLEQVYLDLVGEA